MEQQPISGEDALTQWSGDPLVAVWGLGKLGLPLASVLADAGFEVVGVEKNKSRLDQLREGQALSRAHGISFEGLGLTCDHLTFVDGKPAAPFNFIVVPTPSNPDGSFSSLAVEEAVEEIKRANVVMSGPVYIIVVSTVSPGTCERIAGALGPMYKLLYNPTFIALDSVVHDLTQPNLLFAGYSGWPYDIQPLWQIWKRVFDAFEYDMADLTCLQASYVEVELLKLSVNAVLGTKISLANSLGKLFKAYGADPKIVSVLGDDPRLGAGYFTPGGPIEGPCLPRDNAALRHAAHKHNIRLPISEATDEVDIDHRRQVLYTVCKPDIPKSVGILGMSYKYGLSVTDGSMGSWLLENLSNLSGVTVSHYDDYREQGHSLDSVLEAEVIVVTQPQYETMLKNHKTKGRIIRLWE